MGKVPHNFREFFTLLDTEKKTSNKKAVCNFCIKEYTLPVASVKPDCFVSNKAKLCRTEELPFNKSSTATSNKQPLIENYFSKPLSKKNNSYFEILLLRMLVSNGLSFTFLENQETKDVFNFISPAIKLPGRQAMSNRILPQSTKLLRESIIQLASNDKIGVTAALDGWVNIKQEHLLGIIFITSTGESLVWGVRDISDQRSKTDDVVRHIKEIMYEAEENKIKINCFVSDSAGEYAAARLYINLKIT
nr:475_t:CDS:2 [Entrophospora candida]